MGIAENKQTVLTFIQGMSKDPAVWDSMAENAEWWIQGKGTISKAEIRAIAQGGIGGMVTSAQMFIDHVTAEDNRVAVEAHSEIAMTDGRLFENTYHFLFVLDDEGKIVSGREHFDTGYARDFFGAEAQDAVIAGAKAGT